MLLFAYFTTSPRYTYYALEFLERVTPSSGRTMAEFLTVCPKRVCISTVGTRTDLFRRDPAQVPITDFFGSVRRVEAWDTGLVNLTGAGQEEEEGETEVRRAGEKFKYLDQLPIDNLL